MLNYLGPHFTQHLSPYFCHHSFSISLTLINSYGIGNWGNNVSVPCIGSCQFYPRDECFMPPSNSYGIRNMLMQLNVLNRKEKRTNYTQFLFTLFLPFWFTSSATHCILRMFAAQFFLCSANSLIFLCKTFPEILPIKLCLFTDNIPHSSWYPFKNIVLNIFFICQCF